MTITDSDRAAAKEITERVKEYFYTNDWEARMAEIIARHRIFQTESLIVATREHMLQMNCLDVLAPGCQVDIIRRSKAYVKRED